MIRFLANICFSTQQSTAFSKLLLTFSGFLVAFLEPREFFVLPHKSEGVCLPFFDKNFQFHITIFMNIKDSHCKPIET